MDAVISSLYVIFILILIIYMLKLWNLNNTYGKYILKLRSRKGTLFFHIIIMLFWIYYLADSIIECINVDYYRNSSHMIWTSLMWIFICLLHISRYIKYSEIREKGIYLERGFYNWSRIYYYEWMPSDTIRFKGKGLVLGDSFEEKVKLHYKSQEEVDQILREYIEPYSPDLHKV